MDKSFIYISVFTAGPSDLSVRVNAYSMHDFWDNPNTDEPTIVLAYRPVSQATLRLRPAIQGAVISSIVTTISVTMAGAVAGVLTSGGTFGSASSTSGAAKIMGITSYGQIFSMTSGLQGPGFVDDYKQITASVDWLMLRVNNPWGSSSNTKNSNNNLGTYNETEASLLINQSAGNFEGRRRALLEGEVLTYHFALSSTRSSHFAHVSRAGAPRAQSMTHIGRRILRGGGTKGGGGGGGAQVTTGGSDPPFYTDQVSAVKNQSDLVKYTNTALNLKTQLSQK